MTASVVEKPPEVSLEETPFSFSPHADARNRDRRNSLRSAHTSISVPAYGAFEPAGTMTSHTEAADEAIAYSAHGSKKSLRSAEDVQDQRKSDLGRLALVLATTVLVVSIGLATRKHVEHEGNDLEGGDGSRDAKSPDVVDSKMMLAAESGNLQGTPNVYATASLPEMPGTVPVPASYKKESADIIIEQENLDFASGIYIQKEAVDAKRKWMQMLRDKHRRRRHKRNQHLQRMRKLRLERLKAARLRMRQKMQALYGSVHDRGLETKRSKEKDDVNKPPNRFHWKDPRRVVSLMMRLLRKWLLAMRKRLVEEVE
jgi:hypothetical protein